MLGKISEALLAVPMDEDRDSSPSVEVPGPEGLKGGAGCGQCAASVPTEKMMEENYKEKVQLCWQDYKIQMDSIEKDWCDWAIISRYRQC